MLHSIALPCRRSSRDRGNVRAELEDDGDHEIGDGEEERGSSIEELVGYVVMEGGEGEWRDKRNRQEEEERIKRHVSELVPRWMVPRWIMIMEEGRFPINRTGKIDKSKLPIPRLDDSYHASAEFPLSTGSDLGRQRLGPSQLPFSGSSVKATIQRVWFELTGTRPHDEQRFFEAGGNSIMLLKLHQRLQREFACVVSVADLLRHVTVEAQTSLIERQLAQQHSRALQPGIARAPDLAVPAPSISRHTAVAVIGLACRVPSCDSASEFWQALLEGRDCITRWTAEEMMAFGVLASVVQRANYVRANGVLQQAEWFDASFFELNANEAALIDPQHRMLLECSHDALREGGLVPRAFDGRIGCFLSTAKSTWDSYVGARLAGDGKLHEGDSAAASAFLVERGNLADAAPCLVAYKLGLQGPAVAVQMACASSLAAVHLACRAIANGDCTAALAGGCSVQFPQHQGYVHSPGMILSADGRCRSFDAQASGLVSGDGVGVVVLMELEEAQRHGYPIQAVIRGSFIVNDGSDKLSFSASNPDAQALAIRSALAQAQLQPHDIDVIEAHGSGTQLGDLQEYQALHQVFSGSEAGSWRRSRDTTWLGSVKSNVGHLGPAAGIAGLIKTILAMRRGVVPATVHFQQLHPSMQGLGASRLRVSSSAQAWDHREGSSSARGRSDPTRKALVHSLGQGGNNVSVVIEEYRERQPAARHSHSDLASMADRLRRSGGGGSVAAAAGESFCQDQAVLLVTAHTRVALLELCSALLQSVHEIGEHVTSPLAQDEHLWALCHSLYCASSNATLGRRYRAAIVCRASSSSAARALARTVASQREDEAVLASERPLSLSDSSPFAYVDSEQAVFERPDVAFVFAGQGGIAQGTGVFLYSHSSIFAHSFDSCAVAMFEHTGLDARKLLFGGGESLSASQSRASETIIECESSHVVGFALAVATIEWLRSVGIRAAIVAGHSLGEVAAAYACGALSLGQATAIVVARAKALSRIESGLGGMLWLQAGENQAQCLIDSDPSTASSLNVAGANAPLSTVVSGPLDAIAALEHRCREAGIATKRIKVSHAFHSPMVESVLASFESSVAAILSAGEHSSAPGRAVAGGTHDGGTYLSCVTGEPLGDFTAVLRSASYWRQHMRQTVRFSDACRQLYERANNRRVVVVEIGASRVLSSLVRENRPHLGDAGSIVREDREREVVILGSLLRDGTSALQVLEFLGQAWAHGIDVAWERVFDWSACKRAPLPAYPYQRVPCSPLELDFDYHSNSAAMAMKIESSCERVVELSCVTTARGTMIQQVPHDGTAPLDESLFAVGCVSGLLTVALLARLMKLYPGGALQLEATLASLLPASMCGKVAGRIRLVHLASHTSGLLCFPHDLAERENADLPLQQQLMAFDEQRLSEYLQRGCRLEFEPGEQCLYSNFGIAILAHVISHVMQRSYLELLEELLLLPLGIGQVCIGPQARGDNKSFASTLDRAGGRVEPWQCGPIFGAADGVYMTPRQCLRFSEILARPASAIEREVSCGVRRFMLRNREAPAASEQYEWYMGRTQASCIWIGVDATRGVGAVVMSNADMEAPALLAAGDRLLSSQRGMAARSLTREVLLLWAGQSVDRGAMNHQIDATPNQMPLEATIDSKQPATTRETATESVPRTSKLDVRDAVVACIARVIRVEVATFEQSLLAASFKELGIDSLQLIILSDSLSVALAQPVPLVALYEHATPQALIVYLQQRGQDASLLGSSTPAQEPKRTFSSHEGSAPAVIACTMATRGSGGSTLMAGALRSFEVEEQQALARAAEAVAAWHTAVGQGAVVRLAHDVRSSTVPLPVVASPASVRVASVAQLCARIEDSRSELRTMLAHAGALLFRGYHVHGAEDFSAVVSALAGSSAALREYRDGISPRTVVLDRVYTSTEYPACYDMALHNEMSYSREPPSCIAFCCVVAPEYGSGGQTPLVDSRRVLRRLDPEVVRTFRQQSLLYQVNYPSRGMGPGVSWQTAFDTEEAALVERYCRELGAEFEWLPYESLELQQEASSSSTSAPAQRLRTYKVGPTIRVHPVTQQEVWSNHAHLFHPSDLPTPTLEALQRTYGNDTSSLPKNCTFADPEHTPLASDQLAHIRHTLWTESVSFDWMAGDILVVDNLAVAHGRRAFVGERLILAAMF